MAQLEEFEIPLLHTDLPHPPLVCDLATPALTTIHERLDVPELPALMSGSAGEGETCCREIR